MKRSKIIHLIALFFLLSGLSVSGQSLQELTKSFENPQELKNDYDDFRGLHQKELDTFQKQNRHEYEKNRRQTQKEFGEYLKQNWQDYKLMQGEAFPEIPEPKKQPIAQPETFNNLIQLPGNYVEKRPAMPQQQNLPLPIPISNNALSIYNQTNVSFFGSKIIIPYDPKFAVKLRSTKETDIGDFWIKLADADFLYLIDSCRVVKEALCLNDWGYYLLAQAVAKRIYPARSTENERTVLTAFLLDEAGYEVRIVRDHSNGNLELMSVFKSNLYNTSFFEEKGKRYYMLGKSNSSKWISSYIPRATEEKQRIDLKIIQPLKLKNNLGTFIISENIIGIPLKITYNRNAIDFYNTIPVTDLEVYFNSRGSMAVQQSFDQVLKPVVAKLSEKDAAATLLRIMHHAFKYKTDQEQFGYERPFFFEELFSYPYNNCKDRSVLYAFLINQLVGLPVVGLKYPGHVATAVKFNEHVDGNFIEIGKEPFIICDPTFPNANVGQSRTDFVNVRAVPVFIHL